MNDNQFSSSYGRMTATPIRRVDERVLPFAPEQFWPVLAGVKICS